MDRDLAYLERTSFDLIVVGGGIYGACIAWDAVLRGLSVALLEKNDFGHATSANSLKTVHGGLRYLQKLDLKRMRESIHERRTLMRIAPHLVHPLPFLMPTYGHTWKGREVMATALLINDLISCDRNRLADPQKHLPGGQLISRTECLKRLPGIEENGLTGGAIWYDALLYNSERLTLSFLRSAAMMGAVVANYVKVIGFLKDGTRVVGVQAVDLLDGVQIEVHAKTVVNAAGPGVKQLFDNFQGNVKHPKGEVRLALAINLITPPLFDTYGVGISAKNGRYHAGGKSRNSDRLLFIVPWRNRSLIGTTYKPFNGTLDPPRVNEQDILTFLQAVNEACPGLELRREDVVHSHIGLVPISGIDPDSGAIRREGHYQIRDHRDMGIEGIISVLGVKYTTARDVAEKVVDKVFKAWNRTPPASRSATTPLHDGRITRFAEFVRCETEKRPGALEKDTLLPLLYNYGSAYPAVLNYFDRHMDSGKPLTDSRALLRAQTIYAVRHEMAIKLSDVVFRRTEVGSAGPPDADTLGFCATIMASERGWSKAQMQQEIQEVNAAFTASSPTVKVSSP